MMPYDLYDYFLKQRNNKTFSETTNIVRQKLWRETYDIVEFQKWEEIADKIRKI